MLDANCDEYGKTWFLFWINDGWRWRSADGFCPPNYQPKYRVIVAGSRSITNQKLIFDKLDESKGIIKEVVSGEAKGPDTFGHAWANKNKIPVKSFPADWTTYGNKAGMIRNEQMAAYAEYLIAFWDGQSAGTKNMITLMKDLGKKVEVIQI